MVEIPIQAFILLTYLLACFPFRAPREQMMAAASGQQSTSAPATTDMKSDLVGNIQGQDVEAARAAAASAAY